MRRLSGSVQLDWDGGFGVTGGSAGVAPGVAARRLSRRCRASGTSSPRRSRPCWASAAASRASAAACSCSISALSRVSSCCLRAYLRALRVRALARTLVPSGTRVTSDTQPRPCATCTTATSTAPKSARCRRRNSQIVRCWGRFPAASIRKATSSSSFCASRREESTPVA